MCEFSYRCEQGKKDSTWGNLSGVDFVLAKLVCSSLVDN
jgi:hypothetical protein